jgi:hypothetical protein
MQAGQSTAHFIQAFFPQRFFDARKYHVFFQAHMIVKKYCEMRQLFRFDWNFRRKALLEIQHSSAYFGMVCEDAHDVGVPVEPSVP